MESVAGRMLRPSTPPSVAMQRRKYGHQTGRACQAHLGSVEVRNASLTSILKLRKSPKCAKSTIFLIGAVQKYANVVELEKFNAEKCIFGRKNRL